VVAVIAVAVARRITFEVPGVPQPQGSTKSFRRGTKIVTTSDNPRLRPWRDALCWHAREALGGHPRFEGPVVVSAVFWLPRPAGHFGSGRNAGHLRPSAPTSPTVPPDLDKLVRAALDALSEAGVWRDDAQVVGFGEVAKRYSDKPGACIAVEAAG
jgi:Holliday junction resolvase RusA-like endonuclease